MLDGVIRAQVLGVTQGRALILAAGRAVSVPAPPGVMEGQTIEARFQKTPEGKSSLSQVQILATAPMASEGLSQTLQRLGVPPSDASILVAHKALQMGIPLTRDLFQKLGVLMSQGLVLKDATLMAALLLYQYRLPLGSAALDLFRRYLEGRLNLRQLLQKEVAANIQVADLLQDELEALGPKGLDLKRLLARSGLHLAASLGRGDTPDILGKNLSEVSRDDVLNLRDLMHLYNLLVAGAEEGFLIALPLVIDQRVKEIWIRWLRRKRKGRKPVFCLDLYLELSSLGNLGLFFEQADDHLQLFVRGLSEENRLILSQLDLQSELSSIPGVEKAEVYLLTEGFTLPAPQIDWQDFKLECIDVLT